MKDSVKWGSETDLLDRTPMAYKNNTATQVHRAGFPEIMIGISTQIRSCVARKACLRSPHVCHVSLETVLRCMLTNALRTAVSMTDSSTTIFESICPLSMSTMPASNSVHLRIIASIHSSTPADFEAKWIDMHMRHKERHNHVQTDNYFMILN